MAAGYVVRISVAPVRGEETRRGLLSWNMLTSGEWRVARQQDVPLIDRPPGFYWINAVFFRLTGSHGVAALRLATVLSTFLTVLLIYFYARQFMIPPAAFAAGAAYATMGLVLDFGRRAETEGVFTFLVAMSLLAWHSGYVRRWPAWVCWTIGYFACALAALVKGTQAPITFVGATVLLLLLRRDWRFLFSAGHAIGIIVFIAVVAAWQLPFFTITGWDGVWGSWLGPTAQRLDATVGDRLAHLAVFPIELLIGILPWSVLLIAMLFPAFRRDLGPAAPAATFCLIGMLVVFGPTWVVPDARGRYALPMLPLAAVLAGVVVNQCIRSSPMDDPFWRQAMRGFAIAVLLGAVAVLAATTADQVSSATWATWVAQPPLFTAAYVLAGLIVSSVLWRSTKPTARNAVLSTTALAAFVVLSYNGAVLNSMLRNEYDVGAGVRQVKSVLPADARLASLGLVPHQFEYFYDGPIRRVDWPQTAGDLPADVEYVCFPVRRGIPTTPPIAYEEIASIPMNRSRRGEPSLRVVVGRVVRNGTTAPASSS